MNYGHVEDSLLMHGVKVGIISTYINRFLAFFPSLAVSEVPRKLWAIMVQWETGIHVVGVGVGAEALGTLGLLFSAKKELGLSICSSQVGPFCLLCSLVTVSLKPPYIFV